MIFEEDGKLYVYLTPLTGPWSSLLMKKMSNVLSVNISGCTQVDPDKFVESLANNEKITRVAMNGCTQFTECHILTILKSMPNLEVFEALKTTPIKSQSVSEALSQSDKLRVLKVVPNLPFVEKRYWCNLRKHFSKIDFGEDIENIH